MDAGSFSPTVSLLSFILIAQTERLRTHRNNCSVSDWFFYEYDGTNTETGFAGIICRKIVGSTTFATVTRGYGLARVGNLYSGTEAFFFRKCLFSFDILK